MCITLLHLFLFRFTVRQVSSSPVTRDVQPQTIHDGLKKPCTKYFILDSIIISVTVALLLSLCTILSHHNAYYQLTTIKLNVVRGMHNSSPSIPPSVLMPPRPSHAQGFQGQRRSRLTAQRLRDAASAAHALIYCRRRICKSKSYLVNNPLAVFHA